MLLRVKPGGTTTKQQGISGAKQHILPPLPAVVILRGKMGGGRCETLPRKPSMFYLITKKSLPVNTFALCELCNCRFGWLTDYPSEVVTSAPYIYFMM